MVWTQDTHAHQRPQMPLGGAVTSSHSAC